MKKTTRKTDTLGRRKYSVNERRKLVSNYKRSGLSQADFCRKNETCATTFNNWLRQFGGAETDIADVNFAEAEIVVPSVLDIEIEYPDGRRLKMHNFQLTEEHAIFIRQVASC